MRAARLLVALALAVAAGGCLRSTTFHCVNDIDCGSGTCEQTVGFCSFADSSCDSGRRYGELSGDLADLCVGDNPPDIDGPPGQPDAPIVIDGAPDSAVSLCLGSYGPLSGANHVYRLLAAGMKWTEQQIICAGEAAYLVVPDDAAELMAVSTLAAGPTWVGISDTATEDVWLTVRGATAGFLPWGTNQPDDNPPGEDCVLAPTMTTFSDERCTSSHPAVCECEP